MKQPTPQPSTFVFSSSHLAVAAACLLAVVHVLWLFLRPHDHLAILSALGLGLAWAIGVRTQGLQHRSNGPHQPLPFSWMHASLGALFLAESARAMAGFAIATELAFRINEIGRATFLVCSIIGLLRLPRQSGSRLESLRSGLDVAATVAATWVYVWHFLIERLMAGPLDLHHWLSLLRAGLIPVLVAVLVLTAFRGTGSRPIWPGLALMVFVAADAVSIFEQMDPNGWFIAQSLMTWGAVLAVIANLQDGTQPEPLPDQAALNPGSTLELRAKLHELARPLRQPRWTRVLQLGGPFGTIAFVYALHLFEPDQQKIGSGFETGIKTGTLPEISLMVVVGLVLLRQTLTILESRRLSRDLRDLNQAFDERVQDRTAALEESRLRLIASRRLDRDRNDVLELIARDESVSTIREHLDRINDLDHYGFASQELLETTDRLNEIAEQRRELTRQLEHQATHDALTGLPNRLLGERLLERLIREENLKTDLQNGPGKLGVLFLDLDRFKQINDTLGHSIGDQMLFSIAARLRRSLEPEQVLIRTGGDEFALIVPNLPLEADATLIANALVKVLETPFKIGQTELFVGASVGVAIYPEDGLDAVALQKHADIAMYHAKLEGVPVRRFSQRMIDAARERLRLETALRQELERIARGQALEKNAKARHAMSNSPISNEPIEHPQLGFSPKAIQTGFAVCYQPQVDVNTDTVSGFEALLRWNHPELGSIPPSKFIPIAEEIGLIVPLGAWVLEQACQQNAAWQRAGLRAVKIAVNVSSLQFERPDFVNVVRETLLRSGLQPEYLELELTETVFGGQSEELVRRMAELRDLGVHLSIDDFGTEYSSLRYLQTLPIDALKIDRSFTQGLELQMQQGSRSTLPLIQAIISLAKGFKMTVIAEGVEDEAVLEELRAQGCNIVQGFLFAKAVPPLDAALLLASQRLTRQPEMLN
jgi:diguanylate cyclase (GGDEF)-like protein